MVCEKIKTPATVSRNTNLGFPSRGLTSVELRVGPLGTSSSVAVPIVSCYEFTIVAAHVDCNGNLVYCRRLFPEAKTTVGCPPVVASMLQTGSVVINPAAPPVR